MYNAFWRHGLFVRGQSFSVKAFDSSRNCCQVIGEGAGKDFRGPSVQALHLPPRFSFSSARFFLCPLLPSAFYAGYRVDEAVSWTQRFLTRKFYLWQTNLKGNVCRNSTFEVNRKKNETGRLCITSNNRAAIFVSISCEERHNKPFWL